MPNPKGEEAAAAAMELASPRPGVAGGVDGNGHGHGAPPASASISRSSSISISTSTINGTPVTTP
eukprot:CAMPEP_0118873602 /NCGR_PEP_ID=MMETSP1163-20130328/15317_1 /TAXON_ID=124430 /ORGANISM="Phaeomonas parva, Strain CCMP2877" /LENGTH=64 /DNA_ID=CAMNT_0006808893 /DNA_START=155 /DNA_END=345 /DNA_ORIENTATION=+